MIARIKFESIVHTGKKKSTMLDHIDIHVPPGGLETAKTLFLKWVDTAVGIKGDSGVFFPIAVDAEVKLKGVEELSAKA